MIARVLLLFVIVAPLVACGGTSSPADCSPASVRACRPTAAGGCVVRGATSSTPAVTSVICSGGNASTACQPTDATICVDDCASTSYNCEAP